MERSRQPPRMLALIAGSGLDWSCDGKTLVGVTIVGTVRRERHLQHLGGVPRPESLRSWLSCRLSARWQSGRKAGTVGTLTVHLAPELAGGSVDAPRSHHAKPDSRVCPPSPLSIG